MPPAAVCTSTITADASSDNLNIVPHQQNQHGCRLPCWFLHLFRITPDLSMGGVAVLGCRCGIRIDMSPYYYLLQRGEDPVVAYQKTHDRIMRNIEFRTW
jgi:hypothetical protein